MKSLSQWLKDYEADHRDPTNQLLHRICVPVIFLCIVGLLHLFPVPLTAVGIPGLGLGDGLIVLTLFWYAFLGFRTLSLMLIQFGVAIMISEALRYAFPKLASDILFCLFILGWFGQFYGHHLEGRKPSFLRDMQYLLIGPIWIWFGRHEP